jgi:hypothetical protein
MGYQKRSTLHILTATLLLGCAISLSAHAGGVLTIQNPVPFAAGITVTDAIRKECDLTTHFPDFVRSYVEDGRGYDKVAMLDDVGQVTDGQVLVMAIIELGGNQSGGSWTGGKSLTVQGSLYENGKLKGTFIAYRNNSWTILPDKLVRKTCTLYNNHAKQIGRDVAAWLKAPTMDANLGDKNTSTTIPVKIVLPPSEPVNQAVTSPSHREPTSQAAPTLPTSVGAQKLRELKKLKDEGVLTEDEYQKKKKSVLDKM